MRREAPFERTEQQIQSSAPIRGARNSSAYRLSLLDRFCLSVGGREEIPLPAASQRLFAFLALQSQPITRRRLAHTLWLDSTEGNALTNLRSVLWRVRQRADDTIESSNDESLALSDSVSVDYHRTRQVARELLTGANGCPAVVELSLLTGELLPDWSDEWVVFEREAIRQLQLHALEAHSRRLAQEGRHYAAIEAGLAAVAQEPLRESAHRVLIEAHLLEGNVSEAMRQYKRLRSLLQTELGLEPSPDLAAMVQP